MIKYIKGFKLKSEVNVHIYTYIHPIHKKIGMEGREVGVGLILVNILYLGLYMHFV